MAYPLEMNRDNLCGRCSVTKKGMNEDFVKKGYLSPCGYIATIDCFTDDYKHVCDAYQVIKDGQIVMSKLISESLNAKTNEKFAHNTTGKRTRRQNI